MKIDLHVHASERSSCARVGEEGQIQAAIAAGLDGFAFTDHNCLVPAARLVELNEKYAPFHIFCGIEVDCDHEHWVVIGVGDPTLESREWHYPQLCQFVHQQGGFIFLAHPFRHHPKIHADLDRCPPDGIEIQSSNTPTGRAADITAIAQRVGLVLLCNSDAHLPGTMGTYFNEVPNPVGSDRELIEELTAMRVSTIR